MEKKKIYKITLLVIVAIVLVTVLCSSLLKNSSWFFNKNKTTIENMSECIIKTEDGNFDLDGTEIIEKATELLGKPYSYDKKGYNGSYYKEEYNQNKLYSASQIGITTDEEINNDGIDCSGLVYWTLSSLAKEKGWYGDVTSGFTFNSPVPANTYHWLQYKGSEYSYWWKEVYSYTKQNGIWVKNSTSDGATNKSVADANLKFHNKAINVLKINDYISDDLRYYEYIDENGVKQNLPTGTIIISYGQGIGNNDNHAWIYIGDLGTNNATKAKAILEDMLGTTLDINKIVSQGSSTHWRIESAGGTGVTINNGDPDFAATQYDEASDGSLVLKGIGPIWAFQVANDNVEGTYHVNVAKKSLNNDSGIDENIGLVKGVTFKLTQEIYSNDSTNTGTITTTGDGKDRVIFSGTGNDETGEVTISKTGIGDGKPDVYTITETNVTDKFEDINDLLKNISIQVYKKQDGDKLKIDYIRVNDENGTQIGEQVASGKGSNVEKSYDLDGDSQYDIGIVVNNAGSAFTIIVRNPEVIETGSYKMNIAKKSRDGVVIEGTADFSITQQLDSDISKTNDYITTVTGVPVVEESSADTTAIQFNGTDEIKIDKTGTDSYIIKETAVTGNYYISDNRIILLDVYKIEKEMVNETDGTTTKKYDIDYVNIHSSKFNYNIGLEESTTSSGETIYGGSIKINATGEIVTDSSLSYSTEIKVEDTNNDGIIEITVVATNPKKTSYSLDLVKKAMKTLDYNEGDVDDLYILGDINENNGTQKNTVDTNTGDLISGAKYEVSQYLQVKFTDLQLFLDSYYNYPDLLSRTVIEVDTLEMLTTVFSDVEVETDNEQHLYMIEEIQAAEGYQLNNNIFFIIINFSKDEYGNVIIDNIDVKCGEKNGDSITIKEDEGILTGTNLDSSMWQAGTTSENKYRIDYSNNTIVFTAPDEVVEGSYDLSLVKKSVISTSSIDNLEDAKQNSIAGAKYKVKQFLNVQKLYSYPYLNESEIAELVADNEITVATNSDGTVTDENGNIIDALFENVEITDINMIDVYEIQEQETVEGYIYDSNKYYIVVYKNEVLDETTGRKTYEIATNGEATSALVLYRSQIEEMFKIDYFDGANTDGSNYLGGIANGRLDYSGNTIIFSALNSEKSGEYHINLIKIDSETGVTIEDETTKFNVTVYSNRTENSDSTVTYSNKVTLQDADGNEINTTNLSGVSSIENIYISKDSIGETVYFLIEETTEPTDYTKMSYEAVLPITYCELSNQLSMIRGDITALTNLDKTVEGAITGTETSLDEAVQNDNEKITLTQSGNQKITLKIPNAPYTTYTAQVELNKLGSVEQTNIAGATFKVTDITTDSEMQIAIYNKLSGENIEILQDGSFIVPEEGIILDFSELLTNITYQILIEEIQAPEGYYSTLQSLTLQISVDENEVITAQIVKVVDINGNEIDVSSQNSAQLEGIDETGKVQIGVNEQLENATIQYKLGEDGEWQEYTEDVQVQENTTIYAKTIIDGVESDISFKIIDNIDKVAPTLESYTENDAGDIETSINIVLADTATGNFGASGIVKYGLSTSSEVEPTSYVTTNQETTIEATINQISANGTYYIWIWDEAGNCGIEEVEITTVHDDIFVAEITAASAGYEDLIGTQYYTLKAALEACPELGSGTATVSLIHDIYNESNVVDKEVTIDLNSFTLTSRQNTATLTVVESSTLILINTQSTGSVVNQNTQAILVDEGGKFVLGADDDIVAVSQPTVTGLGVGIRNNGTFDFYDGNVNAIADENSNASAIYGTVNYTPYVYSVSVADYTEPEQKQTATLAIISGIEARIGRKTYTLLENAVADAGTLFGTDGSQVEIVVVADLIKDSTVVIDETKNIKLDLDGHTYTTSASGYVLENNGKLEIVDTSDEQTGMIYATTSHAILNNGTDETGELVQTIDLSEVKLANGAEYGFEYNILTQQLVSTNKTQYTQSDSYVEIDLTDKQGLYTLVVNAEVSTRASYNSAYINVTNSPDLSTSLKGELVCTISGEIAAADYKLNLIGGHKYYMHMVYDRGRYVYGSDTFTINSVNVVNRGELPELTLTSGTIDVQLNSSNSSQFTGGIVNLGEFTMNGGTLTSSTSGIYKTGIINSAGGISTVNDGIFSGNIAGVENISTFGQGIGSVTINNATMSAGSDAIRALSANGFVTINDGTFSSNYKVVANYNNNKVTINGGNYTCTGTGFKQYNFSTTNTVIGIYDSNKAELHITDGTFSGATVVYAYGSNKITIDGGTFSGTRPIFTYGTSDYAELEINGGTFSTGSYHTIYNRNNVKMKITGGIIENTSTNSSYHTIYTDGNNPNIEITGGTIKAVGGRAINMTTDGTLNIQGGDISSETNVGICTGGTLTSFTLGTKDGTVSTELPKIKGTMGIDAPWADLYFYDGQIISNKGTTLTGGVVDLETDKQVITESIDDTLDRVILGEDSDVAQIGETTYKSIQAAIDAVEESEEQTTTITLLKSIYQTEAAEVPEGKNIQLDLNGQTITVINKDCAIRNNGILEMTDLSDAQTALIVGNTGVNLIENNDTLTINNGTYYTRYGGRDANNYRSIVKNNGDVTINNATIKGLENYYHAIEGGNITINSGSIDVRGTGKIYGIYTDGIVNVTGTSIYVAASTATGGSGYYESYGIYIHGEGKVVCTDCTFTTYACYGAYAIYSTSSNIESVVEGITNTDGASIYNNGTGTITIASGTMDGVYNVLTGNIEINGGTIAYVFNNNEGTINLNGGNITSRVANNGAGTINIYNAEITSSNSDAVYNSGTGTINIDGATITSTNTYVTSNWGAIVNKSTGNINILSGNINSANYAIYNNTTGKIVIGTQGGEVSQESPSIASSLTYGLYNASTGEIYFYDGIIKGLSSSIYGTITAIEEKYEIIKTTDESNIESAVLDRFPVAQIGETQYYTIQEAVDACEDGTETEIDIIRSITIISDIESVEILSEKNIILDLNGFTISSSNANTIINNGTLVITDSSTDKTGNFENTSTDTFLTNTGNLSINSAKLSIYGQGTSSSIKNAILNSGSLNMEDTTIIGETGYGQGWIKIILNEISGVVNISNTNINAQKATICNNSTNAMTIDNSTIYCYYIYSEALENIGDIVVNGENSIIYASGGFYNHGEGNIIINNGTINNSSIELGNRSSGTISINGGTVGAITNMSTGLIEITTDGTLSGVITNSSNGKIEISNSNITNYINNSSSGTIDINNVSITVNKSTIVQNNGTGTINIDGATINSTYTYGASDRNGAIVNFSTGTINVISGTVESLVHGVINYSSGTVNITSGNITSTTAYAVYNYGSGILAIGDATTTEPTTTPVITGATYGVYNNAQFKFYSGSITAPSNQSIYGSITEKLDGYQVLITDNGNDTETATIQKDISILEIENVGTYTNITEFMSALNTLTEGLYTVNVLNTIYTTMEEYITIPEGLDITLNLNGYKIINVNELTNNGKLTIIDNSTSQTGELRSYYTGTSDAFKSVIYNSENCNLTISSGKISDSCNYQVGVYNYGNFEMNGGTIETYGNSSYAVYNYGTATINEGSVLSSQWDAIKNVGNLTVTGGNISSSEYIGIWNYEANSITIEGGTIYGNTFGINNNSTGIITIEDGEISGKSSGLYNNSTGEIIINGGTITATGKAAIYNANAGIIDIENGIIQNTTGESAIYNYGAGTINISGGTIENTYQYGYGVYNYGRSGNGTINISGGTITSSNYGIYGYRYTDNYNNTYVNITGGTIESTANAGIYLLDSYIILTLGNNEDAVSKETPIVKGATYGIENIGGIFNFYDGIIQGTTQAIFGEVTDMPNSYRVVTESNETIAYLDMVTETENIVSVDGIYYTSLESAITAAVQTSGTILLAKDFTITNSIEVPEGSSISINLNAHNITGNLSETLITNNGNLAIIDETETVGEGETVQAKIENTSGVAIVNNGTLTLGVNDGTVDTVTPNIIGTPDAITNNGTLNLYDGLLNGVAVEVTSAQINSLNKTYTIAENVALTSLDETSIYKLEAAEKLNADNTVQTLSTQSAETVISPTISVDKELPEWTNEYVLATIEPTNRIVLNITNTEKDLYIINVNKVDENGDTLDGVTFETKAIDETGAEVADTTAVITTPATTTETSGLLRVVYNRISDTNVDVTDIFEITETSTKTGYIKLAEALKVTVLKEKVETDNGEGTEVIYQVSSFKVNDIEATNGVITAEVALEGNAEKTATVTATLSDNTILITVENGIESTQRTVQKVWNMPESEVNNYRATLTLYKVVDGEKQEVINEDGNAITRIITGNGTAIFDNLDVYENGEIITYYIEETKVEKLVGTDETTGKEIWEDVTSKYKAEYTIN